MTPHPTSAAPARPHAGLLNLRDLGGTPTADGRTVAPGRLLRAAEPTGLDESELLHLRTLGVRSRIDLRSGGEPERTPCQELDAAGITVHHVPFQGIAAAEKLPPLESDEMLGRHYVASARRNVSALATAIETLAIHAEPGVLVHCAWGKDRAGIVVAATLELLGVEREHIVADYTRTETAVEAMLARALAKYRPDQLVPDAADLERPIVRARPEAMWTFFAELDRTHDGIAGLLDDHAVEVDDLRAALRDRYLS